MMYAVPRLFFLNALFDLELGGYPLGAVQSSADEMSVLFAPAGTAADRVILECGVPDEYWTFLSENGIDHCLPLAPAATASGYAAIPWGWNERAAARIAPSGALLEHPDLFIVKTANSRAWCAAFNRESGTGVPGTRFCETAGDVARALGCGLRFPLVAKPDFGASGFGFVTIDSPASFADGIENRVAGLLEKGGLTIEPWCERIFDVSSSCVIGRRGDIHDIRHYRCHTTRHGAFYAVALGGADPAIEKVRDALEIATRAAAAALFRAGYFGPAGFDSFVYRDGATGAERLASVIEINARRVMSEIARALFEKTESKGRCLFRFIGRKKCALPDTYSLWKQIAGEDRYDPRRRAGIFPLTPLRVRHANGWIQPARSAFFIAAQTENAVAAMDDRLRKIISRKQ